MRTSKRSTYDASIKHTKGKFGVNSCSSAAASVCRNSCGRVHELPTLLGDGPVFLGSNHQNLHARVRTGDVLIEGGLGVGLGIQSKPKKLQAFAGRSADLRRILSYAGREDHGISPAQHRAPPPD